MKFNVPRTSICPQIAAILWGKCIFFPQTGEINSCIITTKRRARVRTKIVIIPVAIMIII